MRYTILHRDVPNWKTHNLVNQNAVHDEFRFDSTFRELYKYMKANVEELIDKEDGLLLIPADFIDPDMDVSYDGAYKTDFDTGKMTEKRRPDGRMHVKRAYTNIVTVEFLVIDYDGGVTLEDAIEHWLDLGYVFFVYTSFNHLIDKDNGEGLVDRFRVVVKIKEPVSIDDYYRREESLLNLAGGNCDASTFTRGRGFYWPCYSKQNKNEFFMEYFKGERRTVDIMALSENKPTSNTKATVLKTEFPCLTHDDREELKSELIQCRFSSYKQWFQMIEAMAGSGYSEIDVNEVTVNNPNHATTTSGIPDEKRCRSHWLRFARNNNDPQAVGKLVWLIRECSNPLFRKKGYKSNKQLIELNKEVDVLESLIENRKRQMFDIKNNGVV